jgi:hypothetical protein
VAGTRCGEECRDASAGKGLAAAVGDRRVAGTRCIVELRRAGRGKSKEYYGAAIDERLRLPRVVYDPNTLDSQHIPARVDREGTRPGIEGDRLNGCGSRKGQRSLYRGVECRRIPGVHGSARHRPVGAHVPDTGARIKQPDGIHGEHRRRRRDEQRQRSEQRAVRSAGNTWKFLGALGGDLDILFFHGSALIDGRLRKSVCQHG